MQSVNLEKALLLHAKVREELRITPQILRTLLSLPWSRSQQAVVLEEATLIHEDVHEVEDCVAEEIPTEGS